LGWPQPGYLNCAAKKVRKLRQLPGNVLRVGRNRRRRLAGGAEHNQELHQCSAHHVPTPLASPWAMTPRQMTIDESLCDPFVDIGDLDMMFSHPMCEVRNAPDILASRALRVPLRLQMSSEGVNVTCQV